MSLAIVIINWNNASDTVGCISSIKQWAILKPSIWVVDNCSSDNSAKIIENNYPHINVLRSPRNLGFSGGNNLAIRSILKNRYDQILLLNNDAKIVEKHVILLIESLRKNPDIAIVGPILRERRGDKIHFSVGGRNIGRHLDTRIMMQTMPDGGSPLRVVDYVPGTVAVVRADFVKQQGAFDERYFFSGEMADLCKRAQSAGYRSAIVTGAVADHDTRRAGTLRSTLYAYYSLRNRFLFVRKHESLLWIVYWIACCLVFWFYHLLLGHSAVAKAVWFALWDGLTGNFGGRNECIKR